MCLTAPAPLSMGVTLKNCSVFGSKPTKLFGDGPVSTNQMRSLSSTVMAYGRDCSPLGLRHSLNCDVAGS